MGERRSCFAAARWLVGDVAVPVADPDCRARICEPHRERCTDVRAFALALACSRAWRTRAHLSAVERAASRSRDVVSRPGIAAACRRTQPSARRRYKTTRRGGRYART